MILLHASAILAWLQNEPGSRQVEDHLRAGAAITALDFAAVLDAVEQNGSSAHRVAALLFAVGLRVEPFDELDALRAATVVPELCLADRIALAAAERLQVRLLTADELWG
jgi:ribonuclease VapC